MIRFSRPEQATLGILAVSTSVRVQFGSTNKPDREQPIVLLTFPEVMESDGTTVIEDQVDVTIPLITLREWIAQLDPDNADNR